ncbi:MAG: acyl-CoA thioesterase II [Methylocystis sp.]
MAPLSTPLEHLLALLDLEEVGEDAFRGYSPPTAGRSVFGGQAIAQALVATQRTVPADRPAHSLHGYFVLAGDPRTPIDFAVERVRDGKSFTTRRCIATQQGHTIFSLEASFQIVEEGFDHAFEPPSVPPPESLDTTSALATRLNSFLPRGVLERFEKASPLDIRFVDPEAMLGGATSGTTRQNIWFRIVDRLPDDDAIHKAVLAYLSDMTLLNTALAAHGRSIFDPTLQVASLDHALWFHRSFRADDWLLYAQDSPNASGGRALTRGELFTRDGRLVASVAQEGLIRQRGPKI